MVILMGSCHRKTVYDHYVHTPISGWERNDTLFLDVSPIASSGNYAETLGLRINGTYPFMGLTLIIEQTSFPQYITRKDTLNCQLIDENGTVKGQGVSYYQYTFPLTDLQLHEGDSLHIAIRHDMKREILPGIADIGIQLSRKE